MSSSTSATAATPAPRFPRLRWAALAFGLLWLPSYAAVWGWRNFLQLCDVAVFLTVLGIWRGNALLLSSQTIGSLIINILWAVDVGARLVLGSHVIGGTEYMWNSAQPLAVRLLSLFHIVMPFVQLYCLRRTGYDRRGLPFEAALAALVILVSRAVALPGTNPNFVFIAPFWKRTLISEWGHVALVYTVLMLVLILPAHLLLRRLLPPPSLLPPGPITVNWRPSSETQTRPRSSGG